VSAAVNERAPRFGLPGRIQAPNSKPRSIALVGLGEGGAAIARDIAREGPDSQIEVHVLAKSTAGGDPLAAIQAGGGDLQRDLASADMIFIVAGRGDDVGLAPVVSSIAHSRRHPVTALYIVPQDAFGDGEDATLLDFLPGAAQTADAVADEEYHSLIRRTAGAFKETLKGKDLIIYERRLEPLMRDEDPVTLQEIGDDFGITRERVRQIEARVKKRLGDFLRQQIPDIKDIEFGA